MTLELSLSAHFDCSKFARSPFLGSDRNFRDFFPFQVLALFSPISKPGFSVSQFRFFTFSSLSALHAISLHITASVFMYFQLYLMNPEIIAISLFIHNTRYRTVFLTRYFPGARDPDHRQPGCLCSPRKGECHPLSGFPKLIRKCGISFGSYYGSTQS